MWLLQIDTESQRMTSLLFLSKLTSTFISPLPSPLISDRHRSASSGSLEGYWKREAALPFKTLPRSSSLRWIGLAFSPHLVLKDPLTAQLLSGVFAFLDGLWAPMLKTGSQNVCQLQPAEWCSLDSRMWLVNWYPPCLEMELLRSASVLSGLNSAGREVKAQSWKVWNRLWSCSPSTHQLVSGKSGGLCLTWENFVFHTD